MKFKKLKSARKDVSFAHRVLTLASGVAVSQVISVLAYPLLARLYEPEDFGMFGLYSSLILLAGTVGALRFEVAITAMQKEADAHKLVWSLLYIGAALAVFSAIATFFLIELDLLGYGAFPIWFSTMVAVIFWVTVSSEVIRYWLVRTAQFAYLSRILITQAAVKVVLQLLLFPFAGMGLILGDAIGRVCVLKKLWSKLPDRVSFDKKVLKANIAYPLYQLPGSLMNTLALILTVPVFASHYGLEAGGIVAMAEKLLVIPQTLVGRSVGDVFYNHVSVLVRTSRNEVARSFSRLFLALLALGTAIGITYFYGAQFLPKLLGSSWDELVEVVQAMVYWYIVRFAVSPLSSLLFVSTRMQLRLVFDALQVVLVLVVPTLAYVNGAGLAESVRLLSLGLTVTYVLFAALLYYTARDLDAKVKPDARRDGRCDDESTT